MDKYETVKFEPEAIKEYLDGIIRHWRQNKAEAQTSEQELMSKCYIDAAQSMRMYLFGELLPQEKVSENCGFAASIYNSSVLPTYNKLIEHIVWLESEVKQLREELRTVIDEYVK